MIDKTNPKYHELIQYSNPKIAQKNAYDYVGQELYISTRKDKKYMILNPETNKYVHFGQMGYQDYTIHKDDTRRGNYLNRSKSIKGNWEDNAYSANNLSRNILW